MSPTPCVVGIDPGLNGYIAVVSTDEMVLAMYPMPVHDAVKRRLKSGPRKGKVITEGKRHLDVAGFLRLLGAIENEHQPRLVLVEKPGYKPTDGGAGNFTNGFGYGVTSASLHALEIAHDWVLPREWQENLLTNVPGGDTKEQSVEAVRRLWPHEDRLWLRTPKCRTPDHNMTDSILIALYALRRPQPQPE